MLSERPTSDDTVDACPLCPTNLSIPELYTHVAQHLEQLSLFVLPNRVEDSEYASAGSVHAQDDRSNDKDDLSELSSMNSDQKPEITGHEEDSSYVKIPDVMPEDIQKWTDILHGSKPQIKSDTPMDLVLLRLQYEQKYKKRPDVTGLGDSRDGG
jgi:hypothetical protein